MSMEEPKITFINSEVLKKIRNIQKLKLKPTKTKINEFLKGKKKNTEWTRYSWLEDIREVLEKPLEEQKLMCRHKVEDGVVKTIITDMESGQHEITGLKIEWTKPQEQGAAITYYKRYNLGCIFNIMVDQDKDGNEPPVAPIQSDKDKKQSEDDSKTSWPNVKRVKDLLANSYNCKTPEEANAKMKQLVKRDVNIKKYTEWEAKKDLPILLA